MHAGDVEAVAAADGVAFGRWGEKLRAALDTVCCWAKRSVACLTRPLSSRFDVAARVGKGEFGRDAES